MGSDDDDVIEPDVVGQVTDEKSSFREAWAGNRAAAISCRCTHMCLASTKNIGRCLVEAVAKAAVFQAAGKPFADPKASVGPLSAELVKSLMGDTGRGSPAAGSAGVLSDLAHNVDAWTMNKRTFFGNMGSLLATGTQSDAIAKLTADLTRAEIQGFTPSDRERMSRELLLRAGRRNRLSQSYTMNCSCLATEHFLTRGPCHHEVRTLAVVRPREARPLRGGFRIRG